MKKAKIKVPAKINLTLDIEGAKDGYHVLESLVASVDIFDTVCVKARKDNLIKVAFGGVPVGNNGKKSNAYRAAESFKREFGTGGVDIYIDRQIPVGAGLGSSSADIAGVLSAMRKLYKVNRDVTYIANGLGSDVAYMMKGGYAVMRGRGERVEQIEGVKRTFYLLIVIGKSGVSTVESYKGYDKIGKLYPKNTSAAVKLLKEDDPDNFFTVLKNDLYESSSTILPEISETLDCLKEYGAAVMTGSGSAVYGIYETKKERDKAYKIFYPDFGERMIKAKTV